MDCSEPAKPHHLRNTPRILLVGLHGHRLEGRTHVARLDQFDRRTRLCHPGMEPSHCVKTDLLHGHAVLAKPGDQRIG
ncbi:hypothetical protein [Rhizobium gallicum]|uniref:hypothetical protein n=1 Tax=Rhizobium gallicum TaxID=56730 RepID=UPI001939B309|nr:hypothetical protein [Rhizobium gallicum]